MEHWTQDGPCIQGDDGFFAVCGSEEDAEFAVKAVTHHETLIDLLKHVYNFPFVKQGEEEYRLYTLLEEIKEAIDSCER